MKTILEKSKNSLKVVGLGSLVLLAACSEQKAPVQDTTAAVEPMPVAEAEPVLAQAEAVLRLPVSLNSVMVALVNEAADPLWVAAWRNPQTDKEWRELERRAVQLELAGGLLGVPGTGPMDESWAGNENWRRWAGQLRLTGATAVGAVKARDLEKISSVGDQIVEVCEGCHIEFKPASPTGGEYGELSPKPSD